MKNWTNSIALALTAATLTLTAACTDDAPAGMIETDVAAPAAEDLIEVNGSMITAEDYDFMFRVVPARDAAWEAAMDEIRRTFSVEDFRSGLYKERWPEIWGPDGWALNVSHSGVGSGIQSILDGRMTDRYGRGWETDEATVVAARAELKTDLDRYLFDGFVRLERERRERRERRDSLAALEVKR